MLKLIMSAAALTFAVPALAQPTDPHAGHQGVDHSKMDHSKMDHSKTGHAAKDCCKDTKAACCKDAKAACCEDGKGACCAGSDKADAHPDHAH